MKGRHKAAAAPAREAKRQTGKPVVSKYAAKGPAWKPAEDRRGGQR